MARVRTSYHPENPTLTYLDKPNTAELPVVAPEVQIVEKIVYVDKPFEVEKIVYIDRPFETIKTVQEIKEVQVEVPVIQHTFQDRIITKEVPIVQTVEVIKEIVTEKVITKVPGYIWFMMAVEAVIILFLTLK